MRENKIFSILLFFIPLTIFYPPTFPPLQPNGPQSCGTKHRGFVRKFSYYKRSQLSIPCMVLLNAQPWKGVL